MPVLGLGTRHLQLGGKILHGSRLPPFKMVPARFRLQFGHAGGDEPLTPVPRTAVRRQEDLNPIPNPDSPVFGVLNPYVVPHVHKQQQTVHVPCNAEPRSVIIERLEIAVHRGQQINAESSPRTPIGVIAVDNHIVYTRDVIDGQHTRNGGRLKAGCERHNKDPGLCSPVHCVHDRQNTGRLAAVQLRGP